MVIERWQLKNKHHIFSVGSLSLFHHNITCFVLDMVCGSLVHSYLTISLYPYQSITPVQGKQPWRTRLYKTLNRALKTTWIFNVHTRLHNATNRVSFLFHQHPTLLYKFCAEYQDMLPRPRLVCEEPGLRPIGLSPGVPDKSSRGLGSMSRYSAQILICFIAYIFLFYSSAGLVGNFAGLLPCWCTMPSAIVYCSQNEAGNQTIKAPSMPCCGATGPCKHSLAFMPLDWCNWQIKSMKSVSVGSYQYINQVNGEVFCIPVSNFTVFQPRI